MKIYTEDQTPLTVKLEIRREVEPPRRPADLRVVMAQDQIKAAMRHIIEVEWIGAAPCLAAISDADLNAARERLWLLLGKLDDEADKRSGR